MSRGDEISPNSAIGSAGLTKQGRRQEQECCETSDQHVTVVRKGREAGSTMLLTGLVGSRGTNCRFLGFSSACGGLVARDDTV